MAAPATGTWVVGTDRAGKLYLFRQGVGRSPAGVLGSAAGLTHYHALPGNPADAPFGPALSNALGELEKSAGVTAGQAAGIIQSVDAGAIMQGGRYVAEPRVQAPGTTLPGQGQKDSGSEAVGAGINVPGLAGLLGLSGIEALLVRGLEALVGAALILLGLSALAGVTNGNPVTVAKQAAATGARLA